jgi:hypothetical protein
MSVITSEEAAKSNTMYNKKKDHCIDGEPEKSSKSTFS